MDFLKRIYSTEGRLNRWFHIRYQMLWLLISVTVEYISYFISDASISPPEGVFLTIFPGTWSLVAGVLTLITFVLMKFITSPMVTTDIPQETLANFAPDNWAIVIGIWAIVAGAGNVMLMIRRLHDLDKSGWFAIIAMIPIIGLIFSMYILCAKGSDGWNKYGEEPLGI